MLAANFLVNHQSFVYYKLNDVAHHRKFSVASEYAINLQGLDSKLTTVLNSTILINAFLRSAHLKRVAHSTGARI